MNDELRPGNLAHPKEQTYFVLVAIVSAVAWCLLVVVTMGVGLAMALGFALMLWFANGLLVAGLKADMVKIGPEQLPRLHEALRAVCERLDVDPAPALYVAESGGLLNAFATRHGGRKFVVVYSDILEAFGPDSSEMQFLLGHELGHIKRKHILKHLLLLPGLLFPLLGNAYRRACESSCDRFGAFAAGDLDRATTAMMVLSGGKEVGKWMTPEAFAAQYDEDRGFFVSLYELVSGYPTLSQRVGAMLAMKQGRTAPSRSRHPLAYLFALFPFGQAPGGGAGGSLLVAIAVIALLAGMLLPALSQAREKARQINCAGNLKQIGLAMSMYCMDNDEQFPSDLSLLAEQNYLTSLELYTCPSCQTEPAEAPEQLREDGTCDYVYLGSGLDESCGGQSATSTILACDRDKNHRKFVNILFADGHVRGYLCPGSLRDLAASEGLFLPGTGTSRSLRRLPVPVPFR